ncbi:MAG: NADP-dependent malic enzyme [Candidatus Paracaedimonas acanthamoebae]|uniref:NADP-dependent malic enzyme n=1 Tax=Candidatus Paracaedimonas acanthamoebae TaxID=244581 RepID=A0A8J7PZX1_9PROT|nr:NADP-dependent malic enzyme [Candidatus Paracaedimonas acanthamoebae]
MKKDLYLSALDYHRFPKPGKLSLTATKPLANQRDLSLAYSPGVAAACEEIVRDEQEVAHLTARANLVGVITNGSAVLGLGNIGPLAAKPVMEGKAVLFKKFAGIDVFDIEIKEDDPLKLIDIIASLEPTFGALNLEDIKAPECFLIEEELKKRLKIPVFHDDQHGTAIIVAAAVLNALELVNKKITHVKLVTSGAGAAALACLKLLTELGLPKENIFVTDLEGVVYEGREKGMDPHKKCFAQKTEARHLSDVMEGADIFLGLSAGNVLKPEMIAKMAPSPLILALANPTPEIDPLTAKMIRPDSIVATGRSDFPNQVNNVLCFPFIFRGALDVGATQINEEMKLACVHALANLAKAELSDIVAHAYGDDELIFGPHYIIPKPFDPRLMTEIAPAVAKAAMDSGIATRPVDCLEAYKQKLNEHVYRSGLTMKPLFTQAKKSPKRIVFAEGEEERVLRATQIICDEGLGYPILIARKNVLETRLQRLGLRIIPDKDFDIVDPEKDPRYNDYWQDYHALLERSGITPDSAKLIVRTNSTVIAAMMLKRNDADAMICGIYGRHPHHLNHIQTIIGQASDMNVWATLNAVVTEKGVIFITDAYVNEEPTADQLVEITNLAAAKVREFGIIPKVGLLSHSNFGTSNSASACKMRTVLEQLRQHVPDLEVEGEMHADAALSEILRKKIFPHSQLQGSANLLVMPNLDAANIAFNLVKIMADGQNIGPILLGASKAAHIVTPSITVRGLLNMTAVAVVDAQMKTSSNTLLKIGM